MVKKYLEKYSPEILEEIFGTTSPSQKAIDRWKSKNVMGQKPVEITSYFEALRIIRQGNIDPLLYGFSFGKTAQVKFYRTEDEVYFKIHYNP